MAQIGTTGSMNLHHPAPMDFTASNLGHAWERHKRAFNHWADATALSRKSEHTKVSTFMHIM